MSIIDTSRLMDSEVMDAVDGIRRLISVGYDNTDLTDGDIADDVYLGAANRYVIRKVPNWESLSDRMADLRLAVQKKCAAEMLKSVPRISEIARSSARARMEYLSIQQTINLYESDVESLIEDIVTDYAHVAPLFEVIVLGKTE